MDRISCEVNHAAWAQSPKRLAVHVGDLTEAFASPLVLSCIDTAAVKQGGHHESQWPSISMNEYAVEAVLGHLNLPSDEHEIIQFA
jgi:hypothetical protein